MPIIKYITIIYDKGLGGSGIGGTIIYEYHGTKEGVHRRVCMGCRLCQNYFLSIVSFDYACTINNDNH